MRAAALLMIIAAVAGCVGQTPAGKPLDFVDSFNYSVGAGTCSQHNQTQLGVETDPADQLHYIFQGVLYTPTPCWSASAQATYEQGSLKIDVHTFEANKGQVCIQCTGAVPFRADLVLKRPLGGELTQIVVRQNGQPIIAVGP